MMDRLDQVLEHILKEMLCCRDGAQLRNFSEAYRQILEARREQEVSSLTKKRQPDNESAWIARANDAARSGFVGAEKPPST